MNSLPKRIILVVCICLLMGIASYTHAVCGDGIVDPGVEQCDGSVTITCADFGFTSGVVTCSGTCIIDSTGCSNTPVVMTPVCGDGIVEGTEACDGSTTSTCGDFGFDSGTVSCNSCAIDSSGCFNAPVCGDGIVEGTEACDGSTTSTCGDFGFDSGTVSCNSCMIDSSGCFNAPVCGNGIVEGTEACDGSTTSTCGDFGFDSGTVSCNSCAIDSSGCFNAPVCGNGIVEGAEECDDGYTNGMICTGNGCSYCSTSCIQIQVAGRGGSSSSVSLSAESTSKKEVVMSIQESETNEKNEDENETKVDNTQCLDEGFISDRYAKLSALPVDEVTMLPINLQLYFTASASEHLERFLIKASLLDKETRNALIEKVVCKIQALKGMNEGENEKLTTIKESILQYIQDRIILLYTMAE